jgi:hypothetical protein
LFRTIRAVLASTALSLFASLAWNGNTTAQPSATDPRGIEIFETKIRPVLVNSCYECHSAQSAKLKGGLLLDTRDGIRKGGDHGPAVVPGKPDASLLIQALRHEKLKMPNAKTRLPDAVIADFVQWVTMGAPDPRTATAGGVTKISLEDARQWWSYKPLAKPDVPKVADAGWARSDIDRFISAKLQAVGLKPVADADRATLLRRVYST